MKIIRVIAAVTIVITMLSGCKSQPTAGVVGWQEGFSIGSYAPDIPFTSMDGRRITLHKVREPITIVAFLNMSGENCCWLNPRMINLANRFSMWVTVVQVSLPDDQCPHGPGCAEACNLDKSRLMALCDKDRIAWKAYNQPETDTVFLINENSKIIDIATLDKIGPLTDNAEKMMMEKRRQQRKGRGGKPF
ncbi:MAG: hypothetical protein A2Y10_18240 [Planctomycetes bacterium GWF2_41_51]|nr:MAG: hypothetical protein A2Y10_18240 [Planctomycetes bacterium GWF2_41_51]HBG27950.1 hypothetical protein [Phycisphaerales bacterium]